MRDEGTSVSTGQRVGDVRRMVASFKRHLRAGNVSERTIQTYLEAACGLLECLIRIGSADPTRTVAARRWLSQAAGMSLQDRWASEGQPAGSIPVRLRYRKAPLNSSIPAPGERRQRGRPPSRAERPRPPHKSFGVSSVRRRISLPTDRRRTRQVVGRRPLEGEVGAAWSAPFDDRWRDIDGRSSPRRCSVGAGRRSGQRMEAPYPRGLMWSFARPSVVSSSHRDTAGRGNHRINSVS